MARKNKKTIIPEEELVVAPIEKQLTFKGFDDIRAGIVKWPLSVIRLNGKNKESICTLASDILAKWRAYTDANAYIFAETDGEEHNTITPIARMRDGSFELDLVLRNNVTTKEHPMGVYHPHAELHHIKKENIGLIEVMGLAVLPARLVGEMDAVATAIIEGKDLYADDMTSKHADWAKEVVETHPELNKENVKDILNEEIGKVFCKVLEHAGVYKRTKEGKEAFVKFAESVL